MSFTVENSEYSKYIEDTLQNEYEHIKSFRDTDTAKINLYKNKNTDSYIVCIFSRNQNYDVFRILRGKRNEGLPVIYDACTCENCICILESFVDGRTLSDILKSNKLEKITAIKYIVDICLALKFLHSQNIVHRDIKPENIIITRENRAVLIDLQSARIISDHNKKDTVNLGTVGYAAPEQYGISPSMPTVDIYALGVLLNEMILGIHPTVNTPAGKLGKIIKKCTSTQISDRYFSVEELEKALRNFVKFHSVK